MNDVRTQQLHQPEQLDSWLVLLGELVDEFRVAGDVAEIDATTWAIHGVIPVDGEVILAEFDTYDGAKVALDRITTTPGPDIGLPGLA